MKERRAHIRVSVWECGKCGYANRISKFKIGHSAIHCPACEGAVIYQLKDVSIPDYREVDVSHEMVEVDLEIVLLKGDGALLSDGDRNQWWPVSQIECDVSLEDLCKGESRTFTVPVWLAKAKGVI